MMISLREATKNTMFDQWLGAIQAGGRGGTGGGAPAAPAAGAVGSEAWADDLEAPLAEVAEYLAGVAQLGGSDAEDEAAEAGGVRGLAGGGLGGLGAGDGDGGAWGLGLAVRACRGWAGAAGARVLIAHGTGGWPPLAAAPLVPPPPSTAHTHTHSAAARAPCRRPRGSGAGCAAAAGGARHGGGEQRLPPRVGGHFSDEPEAAGGGNPAGEYRSEQGGEGRGAPHAARLPLPLAACGTAMAQPPLCLRWRLGACGAPACASSLWPGASLHLPGRRPLGCR
jgi:hypothetical protein